MLLKALIGFIGGAIGGVLLAGGYFIHWTSYLAAAWMLAGTALTIKEWFDER